MECGGVISEVNCVPYNASNQGDECEMMSQFFSSELNFDAQSFFWADQVANVNYFEHLFGHANSTDSNGVNNVSFIAPPVSEYESYFHNGSNEALGININSDPPSVDLSLVQDQNANKYLNLTPNPTYKEKFYPDSDKDVSNEEKCDSGMGMNLLQSVGLSETTTKPKRKFDELDSPNGSPEKKAPGKRCAKKGKTKEAQSKEEEESNGSIVDGMSSIGYNSDDDSNGSGNSGLRSKRSPAAKTRAGPGSATDPQSLYARKRRERINERLRILQNLVPNGTKVDISTMLEEAVHYVKLLRLQIKMLSSDEHWMYAPIAYNGMNIGLDL
jgi:hypothetical protein